MPHLFWFLSLLTFFVGSMFYELTLKKNKQKKKLTFWILQQQALYKVNFSLTYSQVSQYMFTIPNYSNKENALNETL